MILIFMPYVATQRLEVQMIVSVKDMTAILGISVAFIPASLILYRNTVIRIGFIMAIFVVGCTIIVIKRQELTKLIRKFRSSK